ncbi:MAG: hypothetical protein Kow0076_6190 [Francisella sp.]
MSNKPLVSVMIATYNQKDYLKENIDAILLQDYGLENIEIVVADDCSTDGTQNMLLEYKSKYPNNFRLILSDKNQGITKNVNKALFSCSGKYIFVMGGDDLMYQGKISSQVKILEENPDIAICYHDLEVFKIKGGVKKVLYLFSSLATPREGKKDVVAKYGCFMGATSVAFKSEYVPNGGYNELLPFASDFLFVYQILEKSGKNIYYINKVLGGYRRHDGNITSKRNVQQVVKNTIDHLNSNNIILANNQNLGREYLYKTSADILRLRYVDNIYFKILLMSFIARPRIKVLGAIGVYLLTLGRVKL